MANQATLFAALSSKLKTSTSVEGVFDTVTEMIRDLKQSILDEQAEANARNITETQECQATITALAGIEKDALDTWNDAQAHTQFLKDELATTNEHIDFIQARIDRNAEKLGQLKEQRCTENELFVDDLMSHKEAIAIIDWLRADLAQYFAELAEGGEPSLLQIKDKVDMLQVYSSIFKGHQDILAQIKQLIGDEVLYGQSYDVDAAQEHRDNERDELQTADASDLMGQRPGLTGDIEKDLAKLLDDLTAHMNASIADLEDREIQASHDFALWRAEIQKENIANEAELARKNQYKTKLEADIPVAEEYEAARKLDYENAKAAREAKQAECVHKANYYASETQRRSEEVAACDECIGIFEEDLAEVSTYTETRAELGTEHDAPDRRIEDFSHERSDYEEAGGYVAL